MFARTVIPFIPIRIPSDTVLWTVFDRLFYQLFGIGVSFLYLHYSQKTIIKKNVGCNLYTTKTLRTSSIINNWNLYHVPSQHVFQPVHSTGPANWIEE